MAISPISPITYGQTYTSPNFKGAPKLNAATLKSTAALGTGLSGKLGRLKEGYNKAYDAFVEKGLIEPILKPIANSKFMTKFADWSANVNNMPSHLATAGSVVTTYFYASNTKKKLNKDEEQRKRAKTLVLNQVLVMLVSTALAYGANGALNKLSKNLGYKFREANQGHAKLSSRMKGFDVAKQLLIFTMMYRYVSPVFVTPVASKISKVYESIKGKKAAEAQQTQTEAQKPQGQEQAVKKA